MGIYVKIFNSKQWAVAKAALISAGLYKGSTEKTSNTQDFINQLQAAFPEVYKNIKDAIGIYKDKNMSGGDKAVAIAVEVLETAPSVLTAIPNIKDGMVAAVTTIFADEISAFGAQALQSIFKK